MAKTLRVCLSSELPSIYDRSINFIYYLYDKLEVFLGKNYYSDPYAIVETFPNNPVLGMLYFCLNDGTVSSYINNTKEIIANIETQEQLEILKQAGTKFFVNSDRRYLDVKTKIISLPFKNGTYELTVSLANDLKINKNTVIGFNPETNMFEIIGDIQDYDLVFSRRYRGENTDDINTRVEDHSIISDLKIDSTDDNIIKSTPYGLYATVRDRVSIQNFNDWVEAFNEYKSDMDKYISDLSDLIERAEELLDEEYISNKILESLERVYPEIDSALENYEIYANKIDSMEDEIKSYTDNKINDAEDEINNSLNIIMSDFWENF